MQNRLILPLLGGLLAASASAEVLQLRDKVTVSGRILAEKRDLVVVDLGYTVITVPRSHIVRITREDEPAAQPAPSKGKDASKNAKANPSAAKKSEQKSEDHQGMYSTSITPPPERSVRELVNQLGEAVVQVRTPGGLGSGFFLNEEGYLITNFHVIEGETQISIEVYHQRNGQLERKSYKQVRIVAMNKFQDVALLKVDEKDAPKFSYVTLGDSDSLSVGERVFAIGSPLGLERTVTEGIVSTTTRQMQGDLYLQTTAQINQGNSGGPLFNLRGEAVGVTNMKAAFGEGIGFAIPTYTVKRFLNHRDAYAYDNENPSNAYRYLEPPSRLRKTDSPPEN
ncbi:MAG TPA: trypsin-like peptidase domain-containing protein [Methylomirabilota bacterium]|nr:trypsin-like peptidase domain-containing protein [Methylomirabilota bacterium]